MLKLIKKLFYCKWIFKHSGTWYVSCKSPYNMLDEFYPPNGMKYCMFCGKKVGLEK